jgi:cell division septation protein DedD
MNRKIRQFYPLTLIAGFVIFVCLTAGCAAPTGTATAVETEPRADVPPPPPGEKPAQEPAETYDLESEMPEDDAVAEEEAVVESIEPVREDSFSVEETVQPAEPAAGYGLGYRVQLAAFNEPAGAREMKKKVMASTGLAVYIDFEDGMYKVRAGDFSTRAEASEARARLSEDFPDCWIVRTTVMMTE